MPTQVDEIRSAVTLTPRIGVTELGRSTGWRDQLKDHAILEIVERADTVGYLISYRGMIDLLDEMEALEEAADQASVAAMVEVRGSAGHALAGEELAQEARQRLRQRHAKMSEALDVD